MNEQLEGVVEAYKATAVYLEYLAPLLDTPNDRKLVLDSAQFFVNLATIGEEFLVTPASH